MGGVENALASADNGGRATVVDVDGMEQREACVVVVVMRCDA